MVREYMADREFMRSFDAGEREAYLLLALFADDAGWLVWDVEELAAAMYRYEPADDRENKLTEYAEKYVNTGRLRINKCGHAFMAKVASRPRSGVQEYRVKDEHQIRCGSKTKRTETKGNRSGSVRPPNLTNTNTSPIPNLTKPPRARARGGAPRVVGDIVGSSEFQQRVPRPGA